MDSIRASVVDNVKSLLIGKMAYFTKEFSYRIQITQELKVFDNFNY